MTKMNEKVPNIHKKSRKNVGKGVKIDQTCETNR